MQDCNTSTKILTLLFIFLIISWFIIHPSLVVHESPSNKLRLEKNPRPLIEIQFTSQPTLAPVRPIPKLHTVTYASHHGRDDRFCRAVESAVRNGYDLVILGFKVPWKGLAQKLDAAYKFALSIPDDDLMLFTDAFDVLYTDSSDKIVKIFMERNYKILFAGECGCWPHIVEDKQACFKGYPEAPTPYRYLNSGTWIGIAKYVRIMLLDVINTAGTNFLLANDQKLVADMFIAQKHPISLDYYAEIFQSMHATDPPDLPSCHPFPDLRLTSENKWHNVRTNTTPAVFHFNGGGKMHHLAMEGKMWYKQAKYYRGTERQQLAEAEINMPTVPGGKLKFETLCTDYMRSNRGR
jgi:hypothetical protein